MGSACASQESPSDADAGAPSIPATGAAADETPSPAANGEYGPVIDGMPTLREPARDRNGQWRKTTIMPDDPAYDIPDNVEAEPIVREMWTEEEINEVHRLAVDMSVDAIDTSANGALGDTESMQEWWEENKGKFHPAYHAVLAEAALSTDINQPIVYKVDRSGKPGGLVYGEDEVHVKNRRITTHKLLAGELSEGKAIAAEIQIDFSNVLEVEGTRKLEDVSATLRYTYVLDAATGKFLATGFSTYSTTRPAR